MMVQALMLFGIVVAVCNAGADGTAFSAAWAMMAAAGGWFLRDVRGMERE